MANLMSFAASPASASAKPRARSSVAGDPLQALCQCQNFDGSFVLGPALAAAVGKSAADLTAAADSLAVALAEVSTQEEVRAWFAAMVALAYLRTVLAGRKGEWMLVERKTMQWLSTGMSKLSTGQRTPVDEAATLIFVH